MTILVDLNVLLDLFLARSPWADDAAAIWQAHRSGKVKVVFAGFALSTLFYVLRKHAGSERAWEAVRRTVATLDIGGLDAQTLAIALRESGNDFEDNLHLACALQSGCHAIVTRDASGFSTSSLPVQSPSDLVSSLPRG